MKVRPSVKPMCEKCKIIKRQGYGHLLRPQAQAEAGLIDRCRVCLSGISPGEI